MVTALVSGDASVLPNQPAKLNSLPTVPRDELHSGNNASEWISKPPESANPDQTSQESPYLQNQHGQLNYIDPGHWQSVLDDIKEVREHLAEAQSWKPSSNPHANEVQSDANFLFGMDAQVPLSDILSSLPVRSKCDALLSGYFTMPFFILAIVHPDKFQREVRCLNQTHVA